MTKKNYLKGWESPLVCENYITGNIGYTRSRWGHLRIHMDNSLKWNEPISMDACYSIAANPNAETSCFSEFVFIETKDTHAAYDNRECKFNITCYT